jgi:hypothetical protein
MFGDAQLVVSSAANLASVKNCDAISASSGRGSDNRIGTGRAVQTARAEFQSSRAKARLETYRPLLLALAAAMLIWAFIQISSEMVEGDTHAFDLAILRSAHSFRAGHIWVAEVLMLVARGLTRWPTGSFSGDGP